MTDFKSAKLIKANHANDNQVNGAVLIATKSGEIIDLDEVCRRIPELEIVLENNNLKLDINSSSVAAFN
ncbi:MAG: hypothetical protein HWD59_12240 [Coxiellaceae bacterium]|nr:MAG: hypothetical protein HWD59_12240 [Coxiellaceae bacterium]